MYKHCTICNKKYWAEQERSFFCSAACRQHSHRNTVAKSLALLKEENKMLKEEKVTVFKDYSDGDVVNCCRCGKQYLFDETMCLYRLHEKTFKSSFWWCPICNGEVFAMIFGLRRGAPR